MCNVQRVGTVLVCAVLFMGAAALAQEPEHNHEPATRPAPHGEASHAQATRGEPHAGPKGYQRVTPPKGWDARPATVDRSTYQHNYHAARSFKIGPYNRPRGWTAHTWTYGDILPRAYWAAPYILSDYWLFALEVPPAGYEWVRDGADALLINVDSGEILQVEYGVFA